VAQPLFPGPFDSITITNHHHHQSPITNHQSPITITNHQSPSPITNHQSPSPITITNHQSPDLSASSVDAPTDMVYAGAKPQ